MKRAALALTIAAACSSPATGYRASGAPDTTSTSEVARSTTTATEPNTSTSSSSSPATTVPPPPTTAVAPPPIPEATARSGASGTSTVSWYDASSGTRTANGDPYNPAGMTFASRTLPFGTWVAFTGPLGSVTAVCTDRGPQAWTGRDFDLSRGAFAAVAPLSSGVARVTWEVVG